MFFTDSVTDIAKQNMRAPCKDIATGHTRNSEIASYVGMDDISYPLKMLQKSEIIEKRMVGKPYYVLNDSMLIFWFKYVNRALSLINIGRGEKYYHNAVSGKLHDFMGNVFECFIEKAHYIKGKNPLLCMFSLGGYTDYVKENAGEVLLLSIEDLYA